MRRSDSCASTYTGLFRAVTADIVALDLTPKQRAALKERVKDELEDEEKVMRNKRDLPNELAEGFDALAEQRAGTRPLRTHAVKAKPAPTITARELARIRKDLNLSHAQAALLVRIVQRFPDMVPRLADI
jgi:putative transcriptional regulator